MIKKYKLLHPIEFASDGRPFTRFPITNKISTLIDEEDIHRIEDLRLILAISQRYVRIRHKKSSSLKDLFLHRFILNCPVGMVVDHINGNGLDNRRSNLRICTQQQNLQNSRKSRHIRSSKYKGVCWNKKKKLWQSNIFIHKKLQYLGCFISEIDAAKAYNDAANKSFGNFAHINNFSECNL